MVATFTYYEYDASGRMTTQWSKDTVDATYFTYNQRDMVTKILGLPAGGDPTCTFSFNAVGERVVVDETGGTTPNYWTYDGYKLLTEKDNAGAEVRRYRNNASSQERLGFNVEVHASGGTCHTVTDQGGSLSQLRTVEGLNDSFEWNTFGEVQNSFNPDGDRLRFAPWLGAQALATTQPFFVLPGGGIYLSRVGVAYGGDEELRNAFDLLLASLVLDCGGLAALSRISPELRFSVKYPPPPKIKALETPMDRFRRRTREHREKFCDPKEITPRFLADMSDRAKVGNSLQALFHVDIDLVPGSDFNLCIYRQWHKSYVQKPGGKAVARTGAWKGNDELGNPVDNIPEDPNSNFAKLHANPPVTEHGADGYKIDLTFDEAGKWPTTADATLFPGNPTGWSDTPGIPAPVKPPMGRGTKLFQKFRIVVIGVSVTAVHDFELNQKVGTPTAGIDDKPPTRFTNKGYM